MNGNCDGVLADTLIGVRYFSNLARIDENGRVVVLGDGAGAGPECQQLRGLSAGQKSPEMAVSNEMVSQVTGDRVIGGMLALHKPDGSFDGVVAISLDVHWIDYMMRTANLPKGAVVAVFDRAGKVIATNNAPVRQCHRPRRPSPKASAARKCRPPPMPAANIGASAMPP